MNSEERKAFVDELTADFRAAKESNSQDVAVWMNLAGRYMQIGANMNWAACIQRAKACSHYGAYAVTVQEMAV